MAGADQYFSRLEAPAAPDISIRPVTPPQLPGSNIGELVGGFAAQLGQAQAATRTAKATSSYIDQLDQLESQYGKDPDYQTAPTRFDDAATALQQKLVADANLPDADRADLELSLTRMRVSSRGSVRSQALAREASDNVASLDGQSLALSNAASNAGSPTERASFGNQFSQSVDKAVASGWITAAAGENYKQKFRGNVDEADVLRTIRQNPAQAAAQLADPNNFASLDAPTRERYRLNAQNEADQLGADRLALTAETKPEAAALTLGRALDTSTASAIFDKGIVPAEGSAATAVSPKGALGSSQILPDTARDMAKQLGLADVAGLSDADLKKRLLSDTDLNHQLGLAYFNQQLAAFDGNPAVAAAAYNGGPQRATAWLAAAKAKFGDNFTPAQFASVVDVAETRDYIAKVYAHGGGDIGGAGLSPQGYARAWNAVQSAMASRSAAYDKTIRDMASLDRDTNDPLDLIKDGYQADAGALASYVNTQRQAAATGDLGAQKEVARYETMMAVKPLVDAAWSQPVAKTAADLSAGEAALAENPSPQLAQRVQVLRDVYSTIVAKRNDDPVALADRQAPTTAVALNTSGPIDGAFGATLAVRGRQATQAATQFGAQPMPFHPAEADALAQRWSTATGADRFQLLKTLSDNLPPAALAEGVKQLKLDPMAATASRFMASRPDTAREILRGADLLKASDSDGSKSSAVRDAFSGSLGGDLWPPGSTALADVVNGATAVYAARRSAAGDLFATPDKAAMEDAIKAVAGDVVTLHSGLFGSGGMRVAAPAGMSGSDFTATLGKIDDATLKKMGGALDGAGKPVTADTIKNYAVLKQRAPGSSQYWAGMPSTSSPDGFQPFLTASGRPFTLDVAALAKGAAR